MLAHLWCGAPAPWAYIRLQMCKDVYHCDPMTFDRIPVKRTMQDIQMLSAEAEVAKAKARVKRK